MCKSEGFRRHSTTPEVSLYESQQRYERDESILHNYYYKSISGFCVLFVYVAEPPLAVLVQLCPHLRLHAATHPTCLRVFEGLLSRSSLSCYSTASM